MESWTSPSPHLRGWPRAALRRGHPDSSLFFPEQVRRGRAVQFQWGDTRLPKEITCPHVCPSDSHISWPASCLKRHPLNLHFMKLCNCISLVSMLLQFSTTIFPMDFLTQSQPVHQNRESCFVLQCSQHCASKRCSWPLFLTKKCRHNGKQQTLAYVLPLWCSDETSRPESLWPACCLLPGLLSPAPQAHGVQCPLQHHGFTAQDTGRCGWKPAWDHVVLDAKERTNSQVHLPRPPCN